MSCFMRNKYMYDELTERLIEEVITANLSRIVSIEYASSEMDMKQATDMIIKIDGGDIAIRVRHFREERWRDWTVRSRLGNGYDTERQKIIKGFADFYLYCWYNKDNTDFVEWWLIDLHTVRESGILERKHREFQNRNNGSWLIGISKTELGIMGANAIIATKEMQLNLGLEFIP